MTFSDIYNESSPYWYPGVQHKGHSGTLSFGSLYVPLVLVLHSRVWYWVYFFLFTTFYLQSGV